MTHSVPDQASRPSIYTANLMKRSVLKVTASLLHTFENLVKEWLIAKNLYGK